MTKYVIDERLRNRLLHLLGLLLHNGVGNTEIITGIKNDLLQAEEVIEEKDYDAKAEELILIAKEMGLL